jgi:nucleoside-diphosphate-sugar epimerase
LTPTSIEVMSTARKTALVAGANGIIGRNLIEHLRADGGWDVVGLSRRGGPGNVAVDLLDPADTRAKVGELTGATHLFYAAYQDKPTWAELVAPNLAMLANLVEALEPAAPGLEHVSLMQGYKVYGAHLGPFKTPARETDAGHMPPEFNVDQQTFLEQRPGSWTWSAIRPSVVGGTTLGNPMNLALVIAVYASISKELGLPLRFPGKPGAYDSLLEMTDADLLAEATVWATGRQGAFNIANGDLFRWRELWPKLAAYFDLDVAPPLRMSLADVMADKEPLWTSMAARHGLTASYTDVSASWAFGDFVFGWDYDVFADTSKSRRAGFSPYVETEQMFYRLFDEFRKARVIP